MRISCSPEYWHHIGDCPFDDCERLYCSEHRLLYRLCDTAQMGTMGDGDVINGTRTIWESDGECPKCQEQERRKRYARMIEEVRLRQSA